MVKTVGSSPRLRGTRGCARHRVWRGGIIPALAGNTPRQRDRTGTRWDHPRACGEHWAELDALGLTWGSSPRLRGTRVVAFARGHLDGIIPALAGNTNPPHSNACAERDHPRACGEHLSGVWFTPLMMGSSPRLRGTLTASQGLWLMAGIIPALAGNTRRGRVPRGFPRDHPRACGEHVDSISVTRHTPGSSPRLRGTRYEIPIIPTYQNEEKTVFLHFFSSWSQ